MKKEKHILNKLFDYLMITVGCVFFSLAISLFFSPGALAPGGASGVAIIVNKVSGLPTGLLIATINIPLFILGLAVLGKSFIGKTLYATLLYSVLVDIEEKVFSSSLPLTDELLPAAVAGAVLQAIGVGMVLRFGGSTGGTDIVTRVLRKKLRNVKTGTILLCIDMTIVAASAIVFNDIEKAIYAAIAIYICSHIIDLILYGRDEAKFLIIISDYQEKIAERFLAEIDTGVTFTDGIGGYTGKGKKIIICAVKKHVFHRAKDVVNEVDPNAFMIVTSASEIFGEGYKTHGAEEL